MKDLCLSTGATFVSRISGLKLEEVKLTDLGVCSKVEVLKNQTTIMGGQADWDEIDKKIDSLKSEIKQTEDISECRFLQQRISRLTSGIAIIKVGGLTEVEMVEKKHRIEDALAAVKSAQEQGIVPGGGAALFKNRNFKVKTSCEDQKLGVDIIKKSLSAPIRQMARNADVSADIIMEKIKKSKIKNCGWDFKNNKLVDMMESGIIDPAKVTCTALQNAVSVSSTLITTNNAIVKEE